MEKSEDQSLVPRSPDGAASVGDKSQPLIKRMTEDALKVIEKSQRDLAPVMRRLGDYALHEEDYEQLHIWARDFTEDGYPITALGLADKLAANSCRNSPWVDHGRIKIANFSFLSSVYEIWQLDLKNLPNLTALMCSNNSLIELDLSNLPALTELECRWNQMTELDLSALPMLTHLECFGNYLTKLELSNSATLTWLNCGWNRLTKLDLSGLPMLKVLGCNSNQLTQLDIRNCEALKEIYCDQAVTIIKNPDQNVEVNLA